MMNKQGLLKTTILSGVFFSLSAHAIGGMCKLPLAFLRQPHYPRIASGSGDTLRYTLINNSPVTLPLSISTPTISLGTISLSTSTCGATLAAGQTCTLTYTYAPPTNSTSAPLVSTGNFQIYYNGRYSLKDDSIRFLIPITAAQFIEEPSFPISIPLNGSTTLYYAIKNDTNGAIAPLSFSTSGFSGTISESGGTCGTSIAAGESCTKSFLYTAPGSGSSDSGTITVNPTSLSSSPLFNLTAANIASIQVKQHSLMFVSRDFGNSGTGYTGKLTILNNGSTTITGINTTISPSNAVTLTSQSGCSPLPSGQTCTETFSSSIPVNTDATIQLTPTNTNGNGNTLTVPVSGIGVIALAPPTDSNLDLYLVNTCTDTSNDGGLVMVTNNSSHTLSNISISTTPETGFGQVTTITNPLFSIDNNVYCNGNQLPPNGYCEFRVHSTAAANTTGEIPIFATLVKDDGTLSSAHLYATQTEVVNPATPFPWSVYSIVNGGFIYVADNTCNLVQIGNDNLSPVGTGTWTQAATACSGALNGNGRLTDVGPTFSISGTSAPLTGEIIPLNSIVGRFTDGIWMSPISSTTAFETGNSNNMLTLLKSEQSGASYWCAYAFTTNSNGS